MKLFFCLIVAIGSLQAMSKAPRSENIGVRTLRYEDEQRKRPVLVELWHPTTASGPFDAPADPDWIHPKEIRNVPISGNQHPLIILSHGHGGDRRDRSWLAECLVRNGFVVASVEHYGNSWRSYNALISLRFWERARDISYAITQLLQDPGLQHKFDPKRIGFIGYSLGGMTGLALGGAKAQNVKEIITAMQQKNFKEIDLQLVEQVDFSEAQGSFADLRIKAMVLLAPATFVFPPQAMKDVKVPVALVASKGDEVLPFQDHAFKVITHLVPAKLKLLQDKTSHSVFLNRVHPGEIDRLNIHKEVGAFIIEFFKEQL